jgi:hypothetical protein
LIDRTEAADGRMVTAARFDGVDEPTFREPALADRSLAGIGRVEVESRPASVVVAESLQQAGQALTALHASTLELADLFRGHQPTAANQYLIELATALRVFVGVVAAASEALNVDMQTLRVGDRQVKDILDALGTSLEAMLPAQTGEDWLTVADILQFDVAATLEDWNIVLGGLNEIAAAASKEAERCPA